MFLIGFQIHHVACERCITLLIISFTISFEKSRVNRWPRINTHHFEVLSYELFRLHGRADSMMRNQELRLPFFPLYLNC